MLGPYALSAGDTRCGLCRRLKPPFVKAVAYGSYDGGLRELIHLLKYEQIRPVAVVLGRMLAETISRIRFRFDLRSYSCPAAFAEVTPTWFQPI